MSQDSSLHVGATADESPFALSSKEIIRAVSKRKWFILASTLAVGGAVTIGTVRQPKIYRGEARILIEPVLPKVLEEDVAAEDLTERARREQAFFNTQYQIIESRAVLREVVAALDLVNDRDFISTYGIRTDGDTVERIAAVIREHLTVAPERQSRIVPIIFEDRDPDRAARIANAVAQAYMDQSLRQRLETTVSASDWLDEQVLEYRRKIEKAESELHEFRQRNKLVSGTVDGPQAITAGNLAALNAKLIEVRTQQMDLKSKAEEAERVRANGESLDSVPRVAGNMLITTLKTTLLELEKEKQALSARYGPKHPNMLAIERQHSETKALLNREIDLIIRSITNELAALQATEKALEAEIAAEKSKADELNNLAREYAALTDGLDTNREMYKTLLKRQAEANLSARLKANFVHWFERAEVNPRPVRPILALNASAGLLVGLLLGFLVVIGGVMLDNTIRSQADVEERLALPFLGILPSIRDASERAGGLRHGKELQVPEGSRDLFIARNPSSNIAECARSIRTSLLFMSTDRPLKRLLVTSAGPSEGKSTVAIGMAVTMAQAGNRVLLLDTDLRRPRLHRAFGVSSELGLTTLLIDENRSDDVIKKTEVMNLDLLPCGPLPPNPAELLHSERFSRLLETLEKRYDLVLLDSPPVNAVTDSVILARCVSGTILVVKSSATTKDAVRRAKRSLTTVNANVLGVVLNDVDLTEDGEAYYYYYHKYAYGTEEKGAGA